MLLPSRGGRGYKMEVGYEFLCMVKGECYTILSAIALKSCMAFCSCSPFPS